MRCSEVREALPAYARDGYSSLSMRRHLAHCTECRAELARYERILGSLRQLEASPLDAPAGLAHALARIPEKANLSQTLLWRAGAMTGHVARNRLAYIGGAGVALAGAVGAALWRTRSRRLVTA